MSHLAANLKMLFATNSRWHIKSTRVYFALFSFIPLVATNLKMLFAAKFMYASPDQVISGTFYSLFFCSFFSVFIEPFSRYKFVKAPSKNASENVVC